MMSTSKDMIAGVPAEDVISACDEHQRNLTVLVWSEERQISYCPRCGKYKWPALHGEAAYDTSLIG